MKKIVTILLGAAFAFGLLLLGMADAAATRNTWWLPGTANPEEGIPKQADLDVLSVVRSNRMEPKAVKEQSVLARTLGEDLSLQALLKNNDRIGSVTWVSSPKVKDDFTALRKALRASFSDKVRDLIDETQSKDGRPPRDVLSFLDEAIWSERLLFVRVRQRLYEFHIVQGHEDDIDRLMDALTL